MRKISSYVCEGLLTLARPFYRVGLISARDIDRATTLLATEFCDREPLSKILKISPEELTPFFRLQVEHAIKTGLVVTAKNLRGGIIGAAVIEDPRSPFSPGEFAISSKFEAIGALLEKIPDPEASAGQRYGYASLAAVRRGSNGKIILSLMVLGVALELQKRGFTHAYAKVTNRGILSIMRKMEKFIPARDFFKAVSSHHHNLVWTQDDGTPHEKIIRVDVVSWPLSLD